jgi:nucleotide-binding universal stress UspA family protein
VYRRILVPLDGSRFAESALPRALALSASWDAAVELATVVTPEGSAASPKAPGTAGDESRTRGESAAKAYLENVEERIRASGFKGRVGRTVIPPGNIAVALVRHLVEKDVDLVIMTTHGRGALQRAWLGSTADGVIRRSPVPILLVRPRAMDAEGDEPPDLSDRPPHFRRVVLPMDGSDPAELLLEMTPPLMDPEGSAYLLLRAVPAMVAGGTPYLPHVIREAHEQDKVKAGARDYLERTAEKLREKGADVETRVETSGQPANAILRVAEEEEADLVAMSTHGRGGVARLLLGSVADKVVRGTKVPVLLYREPEEG